MFEPIFRPVIRMIRVTPDRSCVEVGLSLDQRAAAGFADIVDGDSATAAAAATCAAVGRLVADAEGLHVVKAWVLDLPEGFSVSNVVVGLGGDTGEEDLLVGAAIVHGDPDVAVVRATLDGLTRRLARTALGALP